MALGIGIIGGGFNAQFHIRALLQVRDCFVSGIVSNSKESATLSANLCRELGVGDPVIFEDVESMTVAENVHAIWICAPNDVRIQNMEAIVSGNKKRKHRLKGVACEKPLARTVAEAIHLLDLAKQNEIPTGYLENQVFAPDLSRGKEILWKRAVVSPDQRPYLARCAEEHSGPHKGWFWDPVKQGGGVLNDMMCHCVLASRYMLTKPGKKCSSLTPVSVKATVLSLKWSAPPYSTILKETMKVDYAKTPAEDYAHAIITYRDNESGITLRHIKFEHTGVSFKVEHWTESTTSWSYVGAGLRLSFELLGPECSLKTSTLNRGVELFFSRNVKGNPGEDLVEKQNAESGVMPLVSDEAHSYGYCWEDRHFVQCFLKGIEPELTFEDGVEVAKILMACYIPVVRLKGNPLMIQTHVSRSRNYDKFFGCTRGTESVCTFSSIGNLATLEIYSFVHFNECCENVAVVEINLRNLR